MRIRKIYSRDNICYFPCHRCQAEFSERKNTALWNSKVPEEKVIAGAERLVDGCGIRSAVGSSLPNQNASISLAPSYLSGD